MWTWHFIAKIMNAFVLLLGYNIILLIDVHVTSVSRWTLTLPLLLFGLWMCTPMLLSFSIGFDNAILPHAIGANVI